MFYCFNPNSSLSPSLSIPSWHHFPFLTYGQSVSPKTFTFFSFSDFPSQFNFSGVGWVRRVQWRRKLYSMQNSSTMIENSCKKKSLGKAPLRQLCSAPAGMLCTALVCPTLWEGLLHSVPGGHHQCFSSSRETQSLFLSRKENYAWEELVYMDRSLYPWPLISPCSCKWGLQIPTVWLVQNALSWLVRAELFWLVKAVQLWLDGKRLNPIG